MNRAEHYHGLDQLRAWLMLAGVMSHAADVIGPDKWIYNSKHYYSETISNLIYVVHLFRMETFFVLAGFFSCLIISRKGKETFIRNRINRVFIPFFSSLLLITSFQIFFAIENGILSFGQVTITHVISHLWFLQTLFILSLLLAILPAERAIATLAKLKKKFLALALLTILFTPYAILFFSMKIFPDHINQQAIVGYYLSDPSYYGFYFLFGYALYSSEPLLARVTRLNSALLFIVFASSAAVLVYMRHLHAHDVEISDLFLPIKVLLKVACALSASILLIKVYTQGDFTASRTTSFLVRSSIIIYLFHHPIVMASAYYLDIDGYNPYIYYLAICLVTYILSFAVFLVIDRFSITRKMFGLPNPTSASSANDAMTGFAPATDQGGTANIRDLYEKAATRTTPLRNADHPPQ